METCTYFFPGFPALTYLQPFSKDKPIIYGSVLGEFPVNPPTEEEKAAMSETDKVEYFRKSFGDCADDLMRLFKELTFLSFFKYMKATHLLGAAFLADSSEFIC